MNLLKYKVIFWDFDGVIKESHAVKTDSFIKLFDDQDEKFIDKVSKHHTKNAGISRFKKIPLYLKWLGKDTNKRGLLIFMYIYEKDGRVKYDTKYTFIYR